MLGGLIAGLASSLLPSRQLNFNRCTRLLEGARDIARGYGKSNIRLGEREGPVCAADAAAVADDEDDGAPPCLSDERKRVLRKRRSVRVKIPLRRFLVPSPGAGVSLDVPLVRLVRVTRESSE